MGVGQRTSRGFAHAPPLSPDNPGELRPQERPDGGEARGPHLRNGLPFETGGDVVHLVEPLLIDENPILVVDSPSSAVPEPLPVGPPQNPLVEPLQIPPSVSHAPASPWANERQSPPSVAQPPSTAPPPPTAQLGPGPALSAPVLSAPLSATSLPRNWTWLVLAAGAVVLVAVLAILLRSGDREPIKIPVPDSETTILPPLPDKENSDARADAPGDMPRDRGAPTARPIQIPEAPQVGTADQRRVTPAPTASARRKRFEPQGL